MSFNKICCSYIDYETIYIIIYISYIYIYISLIAVVTWLIYGLMAFMLYYHVLCFISRLMFDY